MKSLYPLAAALILLTSAPYVLAQNAAYSFDNFDTRNGVKIYVEPAAVQPAALKRGPRSRRSVANQVPESFATGNLTSMVQSTVMISDSMSSTGFASSMRGFTTGNSEVDGYITNSATKYGLDPLLVYSIMHQESSFKQRAISPKGARGLMQLMPATAVRFGVTNIFDPRQNIDAGARYVRWLLNRFDGSLTLALAGYNAGEGAVEKYGWRVPPYAETQEYVRRISRRYNLLRDPNAPIYSPTLSRAQVAKLNEKQSTPLSIYERSILTVRLPDGRLQLMTQ